MKKLTIRSSLSEDAIIDQLKEIEKDLRTKKLIQKSDEFVDGLDENDDKSFTIDLNIGLISDTAYKSLLPQLQKLGKIVKNDLRTFDNESSTKESDELEKDSKEFESETKEGVVDQQAVTPALSLHDRNELLFNIDNMPEIKSLLFSDDELKESQTTENQEKKVEGADSPEPKKEPETKEHDDKENPKPEEGNKDLKPEDTAESKDVKPEEKSFDSLYFSEEETKENPSEGAPKEDEGTKEELHDDGENEEKVEKKTFDSLYFDVDNPDYQALLFDLSEEPSMESLYFDVTEESSMESLYFSADELQDYQALLFDVTEEEKKEETPDPKEDTKKEEELHDEGKPLSTPEKGPEPAKKSLDEVLKEYETSKKPYTNEAVASECGCTVEEVAKRKKELNLMDDKCPYDKKDVLKTLADLTKKAGEGVDLNIVEKHFCNTMKKYFTEDEIKEATKSAAEVDKGEVAESKMEMIKRLNDENNKKRLGTLANMK